MHFIINVWRPALQQMVALFFSKQVLTAPTRGYGTRWPPWPGTTWRVWRGASLPPADAFADEDAQGITCSIWIKNQCHPWSASPSAESLSEVDTKRGTNEDEWLSIQSHAWIPTGCFQARSLPRPPWLCNSASSSSSFPTLLGLMARRRLNSGTETAREKKRAIFFSRFSRLKVSFFLVAPFSQD